jgi:thiol:disulfide interchange protein DsbC
MKGTVKMRLSVISRLIVSSLIICFLFLSAGTGESNDNKSCKSITNKELQDILAKINIKDATFLSARESALPGICEIAIDRGGQPAIFYIDPARTHVFLGSMLDTKTMTNLTQQAAKAIQDKKRIDTAKIPLDNALILGDAKAAKRVIIFTDPDCPYCGNLHEVMKQIVAKRKDISFFIKLYPLEMHKDAYGKSRSIVCAKSMQLLEDCFAHKEIAKAECNTDEVDNNMKLAKSLGISGTPAIILPDGRMRIGTMSEGELIGLIDEK